MSLFYRWPATMSSDLTEASGHFGGPYRWLTKRAVRRHIGLEEGLPEPYVQCFVITRVCCVAD